MMIPLDDPTAGRSAPVLAKRKVETRAADAAIGVGLAQRRRRSPSGSPPRSACRRGAVADQQAEAGVPRADAFARGEREPARRGEIGRRALAGQFGDDAGERAAAQRLLHRPEHIDRLRHAEHEEARRGQARTGRGRGHRVRRPRPPRNRSRPRAPAAASPLARAATRQGKSARGPEMDRRRGGKLMQRAAGEPAAERRDRSGRRAQPAAPRRRARAAMLGSMPARVWRRRFSVGCGAAGPMEIPRHMFMFCSNRFPTSARCQARARQEFLPSGEGT